MSQFLTGAAVAALIAYGWTDLAAWLTGAW